jgi:hypothetical protein
VATIRPTSEWGLNGWGAIPWGGNSAPPSTGPQTVNPTAIASRQAMGTPSLAGGAGLFVDPTAIASKQAMGTPGVVGPIYPAYIPSPRAIGNPNVVGPIYPGAIASQQAMGTPSVDAFWTLNPTAIASQQKRGTPTLNFTKTVYPGAIPSKQAMGTPTLIGGPNALRPRAIPSKQAMGIPGITGGGTQLVVTVGGVAWPNGQQYGVLAEGGSDTGAPVTYESQNPPTITSQTLGRWTLQVDLFDATGTNVIAVGQTILLTEGGYLLFAGCVQTVEYARLMGTAKAIIWHITATDKSGICDRRIVPVITYPAGSDVAQTILGIVSGYLNGEGITTTPQSVPATGLGVLASALTLNYNTVTDAFNQIGTLTGTIWYVDPQGVLWFNSFSNLPDAPWDLVENGGNFRSLVVSPTNVGYANFVYAVSNLTVLPGNASGASSSTGMNVESYVMTPGNIGVRVLADGTTVFGVNATQPIGTIYSITVDGFPQTVVNQEQWAGQEPVLGTNDFGPWFWDSNSNQIACSVLSGAAFPLSGATVVINYTPYTTNAQGSVGQALVPISPATGNPLGTCGSGLYQVAIQVQNVAGVADLNAIAAAELVKMGQAKIQITYQTDKPGLLPGQIQNVNIPALFLNGVDFLITQMQGIAAAAPLKFGSRFQWKVVAVTNQDPGNWFQWYADLLSRASNPLPVPQFEDASFALAPGGSLAGGFPQTSAYPVKHTGKLLIMFATAQTPPTGQDLLIFFYVNGNLIPGYVRIPGGSVANVTWTFVFPTANPQYVFNSNGELDTITVGVTYSVTGGSPTPASNVNAVLRWAY